jgi:monothiol glutaredoxin
MMRPRHDPTRCGTLIAAFAPVGEAAHNPGMSRPVLPEDRLHPAIRPRVAVANADIVREVEAAVAAEPVVVVGMAWNPFCKRACRALQGAGVAHRYLEYGSYTSEWRRRNALKMWTGWPTFPMVFVRGSLVGGAQDLQALIDSGELKRLLAG